MTGLVPPGSVTASARHSIQTIAELLHDACSADMATTALLHTVLSGSCLIAASDEHHMVALHCTCTGSANRWPGWPEAAGLLHNQKLEPQIELKRQEP
jgi:hypothetical protein